MSDKDDKAAEPKKKGGKMKWVIIGLGGVLLAGGGVGGGLYASGMLGGGSHDAPKKDEPHLVPKSEQKRGGDSAEGGEGGDHGGGESGGGESGGGEGGDQYASNYYTLEKEFTSNLQDSVHFIQVGLAVSTPYDDKVIGNLKTHEIAIRSAILMALSQTDEDQVFTAAGKEQLQKRLVKAINDTLKQKEGFGGISNVYFTSFVVQ